MPDDEGLTLHGGVAGAEAGPLLEVGTYCGKSAVDLGAAATRCRRPTISWLVAKPDRLSPPRPAGARLSGPMRPLSIDVQYKV